MAAMSNPPIRSTPNQTGSTKKHSEVVHAAVVSVQPGGPVVGQIRPPGSKSLTNRALICAAMAQGRSQLTGALRSEDTAVMIDSLRQCGLDIQESDGGRTIEVNSANGLDPSSEPRWRGNFHVARYEKSIQDFENRNHYHRHNND